MFLKNIPGRLGNVAAGKSKTEARKPIVECVYCGQNPNYKGLNQDEIIVHIAFCSVCFPTRS